MQDIWQRCKGSTQVRPIDTLAFRIVESQEKVATMTLVDSAEEQAILETILDDSKPSLQQPTNAKHYLITTPFRYPPLRHGSRFGLRTRRGLFYGSLDTRTTLVECAYYRFVFWHGMSEAPPMQRLISEHTTFAVTVKTDSSLRLERAPFDQYQAAISNPVDYQVSQALGETMREHGIEAFTFASARDKEQGINVGVFTPASIKSKSPLRKQLWSCVTTADQVSFIRLHSKNHPVNITLEQLLVNGHLPTPAV